MLKMKLIKKVYSISTIIILLVLLVTNSSYCQQNESENLLITDKSWGKEVFTFPLRFAKEIKYEGFEEAHFPKGWRKEESNEFWSYAFAWDINLIEELTSKELEKNLQIYFDGLMVSVNKEKGKTLPKTVAKINEIENSNDIPRFIGTVLIYDSFITRKPLLLNVNIEKQDCKQQQKSIILFRFSPKEFDNEIWNSLNEMKIRTDSCDY